MDYNALIIGVFLSIILQKTLAKLDFFRFWKADGGKLLFIDAAFQSSCKLN